MVFREGQILDQDKLDLFYLNIITVFQVRHICSASDYFFISGPSAPHTLTRHGALSNNNKIIIFGFDKGATNPVSKEIHQ